MSGVYISQNAHLKVASFSASLFKKQLLNSAHVYSLKMWVEVIQIHFFTDSCNSPILLGFFTPYPFSPKISLLQNKE